MKHKDQRNTAILVFSRTAEQEAMAKQFYASVGLDLNIEIARHLINHTVKVAEKTDLPVITKFSNLQIGATFGQRLANALEEVFHLGYEKCIVIGTDCPELSTKVLLHAAQQMEQHDLVFGPDYNGGLYLLGVSKEAFHRTNFTQLSWEQSQLSDDFLFYSVAHGFEYCWLPTYGDVDTQQDFFRVLKRLSHRSILWIQLSRLIHALAYNFFCINNLFSTTAYYYAYGRRGPPVSSPTLSFQIF